MGYSADAGAFCQCVCFAFCVIISALPFRHVCVCFVFLCDYKSHTTLFLLGMCVCFVFLCDYKSHTTLFLLGMCVCVCCVLRGTESGTVVCVVRRKAPSALPSRPSLSYRLKEAWCHISEIYFNAIVCCVRDGVRFMNGFYQTPGMLINTE